MTPKPEENSDLTEEELEWQNARANKKYVEAQTYLVRKVPVLGIPLLEKLPPAISYEAVSDTHLTLPTIYSV